MFTCGKGNAALVKCLLESGKVDAAHINAKAEVRRKVDRRCGN